MPHKKNSNGRHHIPKMRHCVTNWREYEAGLRRRGSLTMWVTDEATAAVLSPAAPAQAHMIRERERSFRRLLGEISM